MRKIYRMPITKIRIIYESSWKKTVISSKLGLQLLKKRGGNGDLQRVYVQKRQQRPRKWQKIETVATRKTRSPTYAIRI